MTIVTEKELLRKSKHILRLVTFFFQKIVQFKRQCAKIWYSQTGHRRQYNTAHALCMLGNKVYRHTLRICKKKIISFARQQHWCERASLLHWHLRTWPLMLSATVSPADMIPPMLHTRIHLRATVTTKTNEQSPRTFQKKKAPLRKSEKIGWISIFLIFLPAKVKAT